jgi:hypothetical protein
MESCSAVSKEEQKLSKKYKAFREHTEASLEDTLKHLSSLREELSKGPKMLLICLEFVWKDCLQNYLLLSILFVFFFMSPI